MCAYAMSAWETRSEQARGTVPSRSWCGLLWIFFPTVTDNAPLSSYRYGNKVRMRGYTEALGALHQVEGYWVSIVTRCPSTVDNEGTKINANNIKNSNDIQCIYG